MLPCSLSTLRAAAQACGNSAPAWFQAVQRYSSSEASSSGRDGGGESDATPDAGTGPGRFVIVPRATSTGYPESFQPSEGAASPDHDPSGWGTQLAPLGDEDGTLLPPPPLPAFPEQLKVQLRQPKSRAAGEDVTVDVFELSRWVQGCGDREGGGGWGGAGPVQHGHAGAWHAIHARGAPATPSEVRTLPLLNPFDWLIALHVLNRPEVENGLNQSPRLSTCNAINALPHQAYRIGPPAAAPPPRTSPIAHIHVTADTGCRTVFQSGADGEEAAAAAAGAGLGSLTAADKRMLSKLVGCLTKDGKRNKAEKMLLDAMHIIKAQLAAARLGEGQGAAPGDEEAGDDFGGPAGA